MRTLGAGSWCWFGDPRAVHHVARFDKTYAGWVAPNGSVMVMSYDHQTGVLVTTVVRRLWPDRTRDDHDSPALLVRPDDRLTVFFSHHDGRELDYRTTVRPEDVASWGPVRHVPTNTPGGRGYTYPQPVRLADDPHRLWLFWRGGDWEPAFSRRAATGTWSPARDLISVPGRRPYVKYAGDGRRTIAMAFTKAHPRQGASAIYYAAYRRGALRRADGRRIAGVDELPLRPSQADAVYRRHHHVRAWLEDVALDHHHRPVVAFTTFSAVDGRAYHYAMWDGRRWRVHRLTAAGGSIAAVTSERWYSGGVGLDHADPAVLYLSRRRGGRHVLERWRTPDGGRHWHRRLLTPASPVDNVRPVVPRGARGDGFPVLWLRGGYHDDHDFGTRIVTFAPAGRLLAPRASFRATTPALRTVAVRSTTPGRRGSRRRRFSWTFGDGGTASGMSASHTYAAQGAYFIRLAVTDHGERSVRSQEVTVR